MKVVYNNSLLKTGSNLLREKLSVAILGDQEASEGHSCVGYLVVFVVVFGLTQRISESSVDLALRIVALKVRGACR